MKKLMVATGCILDIAVRANANGANAGFPSAPLEVENGTSSGAGWIAGRECQSEPIRQVMTVGFDP